MSERASFRGGRGGRGGSEHRGARGGAGAGAGAGRGAGNQGQAEKPKKENILDLTKYMDKEITVKFNGGREGMHVFTSSCSKMETRLEGGIEYIRKD